MATDEERAAASAELNKLRAEGKALERKQEDWRRRTAEAVVKILMAKTLKPGEVAAEVGYDRNTIGRIARAGGVPPLREATVVSKRKAAEG